MEQDNITVKECSRCHRTLPVTEFYKKSGTSDGLQCYCKQCQNELNKNHQRKKKAFGGGNPELSRFTPRTASNLFWGWAWFEVGKFIGRKEKEE